ncbi:peptidase U32 [Methanothermus fervidus DSM 2088]|uniref:Peptidase U32 n=1 Tax=Methanothermus fervidus (strain ATCC 43054 / DSM 2088 / JCM 10308 / V24 S) TaxID=523846 RepID=E3GXZ9_METFV|nr:peptidase U32 family protein [Methanothermus fervidus]ADP77181.1 peptidase U32 [Methanothermus fervidus DSM 2088]
MVELLAPARDFASLSAAIKNGADAVYIGMEGCNLRSNVSNFTLDEINDATKYAHKNNVKLYVCANTILYDSDIYELEKKLQELHESNVDAIIVSDLGGIDLAVENDLRVHVSVQANISNVRAIKVLKKLGASRVILSRELTLDQIKDIASKSPLETEIFIHGAQCMAISGRCLLSSYLTGKSSNKGECLQPCRKAWRVISEDNEEFIVESGNGNIKSYIFSPKDLCMIEYIPELMESGVDAFKIEGRARSADYVATVVSVYREAIDKYLNGNWEFNKEWLEELKKVFNRGFDHGFYFGRPKQGSTYNQGLIKKDVGEVIEYNNENNLAKLRIWDEIKKGDELVFQGKKTGAIIQRAKSIKLKEIKAKKGKLRKIITLKMKSKVNPGDLVYKRVKRC